MKAQALGRFDEVRVVSAERGSDGGHLLFGQESTATGVVVHLEEAAPVPLARLLSCRDRGGRGRIFLIELHRQTVWGGAAPGRDGRTNRNASEAIE